MVYEELSIDLRLNMDQSIENNVWKKLYKLDVIAKDRPLFDTRSVLILYQSLILPITEYDDISYMCST